MSVVSGGVGTVGVRAGAGVALSGWGSVVAAAAGAVPGVRGTHVLLPDLAFSRRQDEVAVIGSAVEAKIAGEGFRRIAARLGVCPMTVRGWLRRFVRRAELIRVHFTRCAVVLDPELGPVLPAGGGAADGLEAIAVAVRAWVSRFGPAEPWQVVSRLSGGYVQHELTLGGRVVS